MTHEEIAACKIVERMLRNLNGSIDLHLAEEPRGKADNDVFLQFTTPNGERRQVESIWLHVVIDAARTKIKGDCP